MVQTGQLSETSVKLAEYLVKNGTNPYYPTEGHFEVRKTLPDGRNLRLYFCNVSGKGIEKIPPNARLEIDVNPITDDQVGYQTFEWGLAGKFKGSYQFRVLMGNKNHWITLSPSTVIVDNVRKTLEEEYESLKKRVLEYLFDESGKKTI